MTEDFWQACLAKYAELVDDHRGEPNNRKLIKDAFDDWLLNSDTPETLEELKAARRENLWQKIERVTKANGSYVEPLTEGQLPIFDLPAILDLPIIAGKHRRVRIGWQSEDDAKAILKEAEDNAAAVVAALKRTEAAIDVELAWIAKHGTIYNAHKAGDIPGVDDEDRP